MTTRPRIALEFPRLTNEDRATLARDGVASGPGWVIKPPPGGGPPMVWTWEPEPPSDPPPAAEAWPEGWTEVGFTDETRPAGGRL